MCQRAVCNLPGPCPTYERSCTTAASSCHLRDHLRLRFIPPSSTLYIDVHPRLLNNGNSIYLSEIWYKFLSGSWCQTAAVTVLIQSFLIELIGIELSWLGHINLDLFVGNCILNLINVGWWWLERPLRLCVPLRIDIALFDVTGKSFSMKVFFFYSVTLNSRENFWMQSNHLSSEEMMWENSICFKRGHYVGLAHCMHYIVKHNYIRNLFMYKAACSFWN